MTTIGTGKYTYDVIQDWPKLPQGVTFDGSVSAIATDSQDRVYAFHRSETPVYVFDRDGNFLSSWGKSAFNSPHGIFIKDDIVYVTDRDDSVALRFTLDGKPLQVLGQRGVHSDTGCERPGDLVPRAAGPFNYPTEMLPAPSGDLYVTDGYRNARVHRFDRDGRLISSWGQPGKEGPNQFHLPHSLHIDAEGILYVCDRENSRVQVLDAEGNFLSMWTDMNRPNDIAVDSEGTFYTCERAGTDGTPPQVSVLSKDGGVLGRFPTRGAHGMWVDSRGDIYLALTGDKSVDKLVRRG